MVITIETNEEQMFSVGMLGKSAVEWMMLSEGARQGGRAGSRPAGSWTHSCTCGLRPEGNDLFGVQPLLETEGRQVGSSRPFEEPFWPIPLFCRIKCIVFVIVHFLS